MMPTAALPEFGAILPEILLVLGAFVIILLGVYKTTFSIERFYTIGIAALGLALVVLLLSKASGETVFNGLFVNDGVSFFMKAVCFIGALASLLMARPFMVRERLVIFEYPALVLLATVGMGLMISAANFLTLYIGLELQSLALYVLAAIRRDNALSTEAGMKYFILGALSSGLLLYGISLLYGATGSVGFTDIAAVLQQDGFDASLLLTVGIVLTMAGMAFKISAVPFHMWAPDVYQGAPTAVTAFFTLAPKVAALTVLVRVLLGALAPVQVEWQQIAIFLSAASMLIGAFGALAQNNIKRLLAYSSIGHMGYALVALSAGGEQGAIGVLVYATVYMVMTAGTFAIVLLMRRDGVLSEDVRDLAGLWESHPAQAVSLAALMFSMAGIPPMGGFLSKLMVFEAGVNAGLYPLVVLGVVSSVVSAYYYLRLVKIAFFDPVEQKLDADPPKVLASFGIISAAAMLVMLPLAGQLTELAKRAIQETPILAENMHFAEALADKAKVAHDVPSHGKSAEKAESKPEKAAH